MQLSEEALGVEIDYNKEIHTGWSIVLGWISISPIMLKISRRSNSFSSLFICAYLPYELLFVLFIVITFFKAIKHKKFKLLTVESKGLFQTLQRVSIKQESTVYIVYPISILSYHEIVAAQTDRLTFY